MARIYVSSTFKDLEECREKVRIALKRMGHEDIAMEYYVAEDKRPVDKCLEDVASCDLYIGIFAWRYGYVPDGYDKSITELEYLKAAKTGKECLTFFLHEDAPWPAKFVDVGKDAEKIRTLRVKLSKEKMVSFFKSSEELSSLVSASVYNWETRSKNSLPRSFHIAPIQVPPLIENVIELPKVKQEIKSYLLNGNNSKRMLAITAIQGLGGIGKTTLAVSVANDEEVQKHFSDGILWVTLGQEPEKLSLLNSWIQALGDYQSKLTTVQTASNHLRTLLHERHVLLVIDDVWEYSDVEPFLVGGSSCQTIITTRKAHIADDLGAKLYSLNVMTEEQSLRLFANVLKDSWDQNEKDEALKVAKDVGYLPLALNLAAKRRLRNYSWAKLHEALEEEIANLSILESPHSLRKGKKGPDTFLSTSLKGLEASLNLSLKALRSFDKEIWVDFIWLGVLPEDIKINEKMTSTVWDIEEEKAGQILEFLWEEGLLIQDSKARLRNEELKTYRMHDLFYDIARKYLTCSPNTKNNKDIPGFGLRLDEVHASLLNRYKLKAQKKGLWHTINDDTYIHSHLTWHLEKAGKIKDIHTLLCEENESGKNGWYEALESLGQNAVFIEDVTRAWNLSGKESANQLKQMGKAPSIGLEIRYALINTSINSLSANISVELLVALLETKIWPEAKVFIYALREPDSYKRATKLISIYQKIKDKEIKMNTMEKAIGATSMIQDKYLRVQALCAVAPNLDGQKKEELVENAIDAASMIQDKYLRVQALCAVVPNLDGQKKEELVENAINAASMIQDKYSRAKALSLIFPNLDGQKKEELVENAINAASTINSEELRAKALSSIFPNLDGQKKEELVEKTLDTTLKIQNEYSKALALCAICPNLDGQKKKNIINKVLDATLKIQDEHSRALALCAIGSNLDGQEKEKLVKTVIGTFSKIQDEYWRALALLSIFPNLDGQEKEKVIEKAFDIASNIKKEELKTEVISSIYSNLDGQKKEEFIENSIDTTLKIQDEYSRWRNDIQSLAGRPRSDLLADITRSIPLIHGLGEDKSLIEISQAIIDVSRWWP